jgi:hypothetical protein
LRTRGGRPEVERLKAVVPALVVLVALVALGVVGCGGSTGGGHRAFEALRGRDSMAARVRPYRSIDELLSNVRFRLPTGSVLPPQSAGVVRADITGFEEWRAFVDAEGGARQVAFESDAADWRTLVLELSVREQLDGMPRPDHLRVGLVVSGASEADEVGEDLVALDDVVLFLHEPAPAFGYGDGVVDTVEDGTLLAPVADDGTLSLPAKDPGEGRALLLGAPTIAALRRAAAGPPREIALADDLTFGRVEEPTQAR